MTICYPPSNCRVSIKYLKTHQAMQYKNKLSIQKLYFSEAMIILKYLMFRKDKIIKYIYPKSKMAKTTMNVS